MSLTRGTRAFFADAAGSMTVEFVVIMPMLLAALTFTFEFARAFWAYDVMTRDVRAGVRYLARITTSVTGPSCPASAQTFVTNGMAAATHFPWNGGTPTFSCSVSTFSTGFNQPVSVVTMTATVPISIYFMQFLNGFTRSSIASSYSLSVSDQTRLVGN